MHKLYRTVLSRTMAAAFAMSGVRLLASQSATPLVPVQMIVTAEARQDEKVPVLNQGDIAVFQNDERLQVSSLVPAQGSQAALELYVLIDDASATSLGTQLDDLRQFINTQPATVSIGIAYMRNGTVQIAQALTTDHANAAKAVRLPLSYGGASPSPFLSLSDLVKKWPPSPARHEVLLIGSGIDPLGGAMVDPYLDAPIEHAQRADIVVYAIYTPAAGHGGHSSWRIEWGQNHLAQIAEETGGESYMLGFQPLVSFAPYLADLADHLSHQYLLTFLMKPANKPELQTVRLASEIPNADLVYARKVYVPAPR